MELTILVAKVFAIYMIVSGIALTFRRKLFALVLKDFFEHPGTVYCVGAFLVLMSSFLAIKHAVWGSGLGVFVSIIVWISLLKGIVLVLVPELLHKINYKRILTIPIGLILAIVGAWILVIL